MRAAPTNLELRAHGVNYPRLVQRKILHMTGSHSLLSKLLARPGFILNVATATEQVSEGRSFSCAVTRHLFLYCHPESRNGAFGDGAQRRTCFFSRLVFLIVILSRATEPSATEHSEGPAFSPLVFCIVILSRASQPASQLLC